MALFAIVFLIVYFGCMVGTLIMPQLGIWGFVFESNFHPPNYWWGAVLPTMGGRWNFWIGAAMLTSLGLHWSRYSKQTVFSEKKTWLLVLFLLYTLATSLVWADHPEQSLKESTDYIKWFLVYVAIIKTHSNLRYLNVILIIYVICAIKIGWDQTWSPKVGRDFRLGTTTCYEINFLAAHIVLLLPIAISFVLRPDFDKKIKWVIILGLPFMANLFAYASSRGSMVAITAVMIAALFLLKGKTRKIVYLSSSAGGVLAFRLLNDEFIARFFSIQEYEQDGSASGRLYAWNAAWKAFSQQPLGYGAEAFDRGLGLRLMPEGFVTTHNMYFEILVAWGAIGFLLFLTAIAISMHECYTIQKRFYIANQFRQSRQYIEATSVLLALVGILVASVFINRIRYEMWWILMAYTSCMKNIYLNPKFLSGTFSSLTYPTSNSAELTEKNAIPAFANAHRH